MGTGVVCPIAQESGHSGTEPWATLSDLLSKATSFHSVSSSFKFFLPQGHTWLCHLQLSKGEGYGRTSVCVCVRAHTHLCMPVCVHMVN